jgi:hypothetical protein
MTNTAPAQFLNHGKTGVPSLLRFPILALTSAIRSESKHCRSNNFRDPPFPQTASADAYVKKCDLAFRLTRFGIFRFLA